MGRKRSTWNKKADPYTMNQDRDLPPVTKYLIGDPSAFGEDVHTNLPNDAELGRNEIGQPNMPASNLNHKDVEEWNSADPYDNAATFSPEDRDRREVPEINVEASRHTTSARDVYAALEKKAYYCSKIATALLPGAPESLIEDQTYELMSLPDAYVKATLLRLAAEDEAEEKDEEKEDEKGEDEEKEDEKEDKDEDKESGKKKANWQYLDDDSVEAMLREMMEEEDDAETEAMLREMLEEEDVEEMIEEELDQHVEDLHSDAMLMDSMDMEEEALDEDPEIDAMLRDMMDHDSMDLSEAGDHAATDFDIGMNPMMDVVASESIAGDATLQNLFNNTIPKEARQSTSVAEKPSKTASSKRGVSTLGGRVKGASNTGSDLDDLSKLWASDPDISDNF